MNRVRESQSESPEIPRIRYDVLQNSSREFLASLAIECDKISYDINWDYALRTDIDYELRTKLRNQDREIYLTTSYQHGRIAVRVWRLQRIFKWSRKWKIWRILFRSVRGTMIWVTCECFRWCGVATSGEVMNASLVLIVANGGFSCMWDSLARLIKLLLKTRQAVVWYEKAPFWMSVSLMFSRVESNFSKFTTYTYTCRILRERKKVQ